MSDFARAFAEMFQAGRVQQDDLDAWGALPPRVRAALVNTVFPVDAAQVARDVRDYGEARAIGDALWRDGLRAGRTRA